MKIQILSFLTAAAIAAGMTSCQENEYGVVDLTPVDRYTPVDGQYTYNHPCVLYNQADFDRVKNAIADGSAPQAVKDELAALKSSRHVDKNYTPNPTTDVRRGISGDENYTIAMRDAAAAYQMALLWQVTGENEYADAVVRILNAWANTCTLVTGNTNKALAAGAQGYTFAAAGEIVRKYSGWAADDFNKYKQWMKDVWASVCLDFLETKYGNCATHYWSNWDLVTMNAYLAIGILNDDNAMVNYVVNLFHNGTGNGAVKNLVNAFHVNPLDPTETIGQNQESGRDQGHAMMSCMVAGTLAQMAYTLYKDNTQIKELDFFAANDNALLKMAEYVVLTNLRDGSDNANKNGLWVISADKIPFTTYNYCIDCACNGGRPHDHGAVQTKFADDNGRGGVRPGCEIYLHHYAKEKSLSSGYKYIKQMADKMRPECGSGDTRYSLNSGGYDQLGWGTLMLYTE